MIAPETLAVRLGDQCSQSFRLYPKREGIYQVYAPLFHEDGDMLDVFVEEADGSRLRICDYGLTLMRLSYEFDIDTENKRRIFNDLLRQNKLSFNEEEGNIYLETTEDRICASVLHFANAVTKVLTLDVLKRETISGLFMEQFDSFVWSNLLAYEPDRDYVPLEGREELEVPYVLRADSPKPVFLYPVKNGSQAKNAAITFLECERADKSFTGVVVHENLDSLTMKERRIITSAADKQFVDLSDFLTKGETYLKRLAA
jgi:hypothetical protein